MANLSNMYTFHYLTSTQYADLTSKSTSALYFCSDTGKIFKGTEDFTSSVRLVSSFPTTSIAQGVLYVNTTNGEAKTYNGTAWVTVVRAVDTTATQNSDNLITSGAVYTAAEGRIAALATAAQNEVILGGATGNAVVASGKTLGGATLDIDGTTHEASANKLATEAAVKDYVDDAIGDIDYDDFLTDVTWDGTNHQLTLSKNGVPDTEHKVTLTGIATQIDYDGATGVVTLKDTAGTTLDSINIPLDNFVASGSYDATQQAIILVLQNANTVTIPVSDLIDIYYGGTTDSVVVSVNTVSGQETITATVRISDNANNALQLITTDGHQGLFVDISGKADKVVPTTANSVAILNASGNLADSTKTIGGSTITVDAQTGAGDATKLATEAGVVAFADGKYIPLANIDTDISTGTPTDTDVPSVAAVVDALSWHTYGA